MTPGQRQKLEFATLQAVERVAVEMRGEAMMPGELFARQIVAAVTAAFVEYEKMLSHQAARESTQGDSEAVLKNLKFHHD